MSGIVHRASSSVVNTTFAVASVSISAPTGTVQNDLGVIFYISFSVAPTAAPTHTTPSGWTVRGTKTFAMGSGAYNVRLSVYDLIEGASPGNVTLTSSINSGHVGIRESANNPNVTSWFEQISTGNGETFSGTDAIVTGFTTSENNCFLIIWNTAGSAVTWTPPTDFTERIDTTSTEMSTFLFVTAGATGNRTAVASASTDGLIVMVSYKSEPNRTLKLAGDGGLVGQSKGLAG